MCIKQIPYHYLKRYLSSIIKIMATQSGTSTRGPRGIRCKSRVDAHWAYIFDELGWSWEYQPVDLNGYIPDFIITFAAAQVLVKVKETSNIWEDPQQEQYIDCM